MRRLYILGGYDMDVKELARRIDNYRQSSMPIYDNHAPIYGNDAPIYQSTSSALAYIFNVSPETYDKINTYIEKGKSSIKLEVVLYAIDKLIDSCSEDEREMLEFFRAVIADIFSP